MLVVDLNRLQAVDLLNLADDVVIRRVKSVDTKYIGRADRALGQRRARVDNLTVLDYYVYTERYLVSEVLAAFARGDRDSAQTFVLGYARDSGRLGDDCRFLRTARLEKLLDSRKTLCDICLLYTSRCV